MIMDTCDKYLSGSVEMDSYKEILFTDQVIDVIDRFAQAGINIVSINVNPDGSRVVVSSRDIPMSLSLISGPVCVSDVILLRVEDRPGSLRDVIGGLSRDHRVVTGLYVAEDNRVVLRYQGMCDTVQPSYPHIRK